MDRFFKTMVSLAVVAGLLAATAPSVFAGGPRAGKKASKADRKVAPGARAGTGKSSVYMKFEKLDGEVRSSKQKPGRLGGQEVGFTMKASPQGATPAVQKVRESARRPAAKGPASNGIWIDLGLPRKSPDKPAFLRDVGDEIRARVGEAGYHFPGTGWESHGGGQQRSGDNSSDGPKRGLTIRLKDAAGREVEVSINIGWPFRKKDDKDDEDEPEDRTEEESEGDEPVNDGNDDKGS